MNTGFKTLITLIVLAINFTASAATLTFEKFSPEGMDYVPIPDGYGGLKWRNFDVLNGLERDYRDGFRTGIISSNNVMFNASGDSAAIECDRSFQLISAYVTPGWTDLSLSVRGFAGGEALYNETYVLKVGQTTLIEFNFYGVDRVEFSTSPGSSIFVVDDLTVDVPGAEPENEPVHIYTINPPIDLGRIVVNSIGKFTYNDPDFGVWGPGYYFVDQQQLSGGGAILPNVSVNWDTNTSFSVTFAAPEGKKFLVTTPLNSAGRFAGSFNWESNIGAGPGVGVNGPVVVEFENLEGDPPNFSENSRSILVLASTHAWFGADPISTEILNNLAFTAITIRGVFSPQITGGGTETFIPRYDCSFFLLNLVGGASLALVPIDDQQAQVGSNLPKITLRISNGVPLFYFKGVLQSAESVDGPFEDVPGNPQSVYEIMPDGQLGYVAPQGPSRFYRVRN